MIEARRSENLIKGVLLTFDDIVGPNLQLFLVCFLSSLVFSTRLISRFGEVLLL